jgi:hypothetical protein
MQPTKVFAIAELDGRTTGNKSLINFGTGVTEHEMSCHRKYRFVGGNRLATEIESSNNQILL